MGAGGRYRKQRSYGHRYHHFGGDWYRIYWTVDRYIKGSRLRYPTEYSRDTDEAGARRFCEKWELEFEED